MTGTEKIDRMRELFAKCLKTATAKSHDYAGEADSLSNLRDFGWKGVVVRLGDKYHRVKNFAQSGELRVKDESVRDTLEDLINYAALALVMYNEEIAAKRHESLNMGQTGSGISRLMPLPDTMKTLYGIPKLQPEINEHLARGGSASGLSMLIRHAKAASHLPNEMDPLEVFHPVSPEDKLFWQDLARSAGRHNDQKGAKQ